MPITQPPALSAGRLASLARGSAGALLLLGLLGALWQMGALWQVSVHAAEPAVVIPAPAMDAPKESSKPGAPGLQTVVLAGGCFWGVQAVFQHTKGVTQVLSGYAGGTKETAQYNVVSSGRTGHAEAVQIRFDPRQISYGRILQIYFSVAHDPTQLNRQGPDEGPQYRSAVFYADPAQQSVAQAYIAQLDKAGTFKHPVVTQLTPLAGFYPAEAYHQDYATRHPTNPYIVYNDLPKVENLKRLFPERYREQPVLVTASNPS
jgi:peptide-methionine (S)-S-oxide reductase